MRSFVGAWIEILFADGKIAGGGSRTPNRARNARRKGSFETVIHL